MCGTHSGDHLRTHNRVEHALHQPLKKRRALEGRIRKAKHSLVVCSIKLDSPRDELFSSKSALTSPSCKWGAEEAHSSVSFKTIGLHDCVALSDIIFLTMANMSKKKNVLRYGLALRQKKVPASSNWLHTWQFRKWFGLSFNFERRMQKLNFATDRFDQ